MAEPKLRVSRVLRHRAKFRRVPRILTEFSPYSVEPIQIVTGYEEVPRG